ncbi:MAG: Crp/Fnr family transcriptional regulator [Proteobacteria bacterium]|nr:Crp/Fnr family transcriptional regulator [Pseudomonadota bacterium]
MPQAKDDIAALIAGSAFFGGLIEGLEPSRLAALLRAFRHTHFEAGQQIFARRERGDFLLVIAQGRVRLSLVSDEGRELSVRHGVRGDVLGELALLDGQTRSADAVALTPLSAYLLFRADLDALLREIPELAGRIITFLCARLRATTDQLEAIALHPIEARLARFLLVALRGRKAEPGKRVPLELGFSQSELAQLLGASRPKVNGALALLETMGAIRRTSDRLFCDPTLLAQTARLADEG